MAWLLACWQAEPLIKEKATMHQTVDQTNLKEAVKMTRREEVDAQQNENHAPQTQHECNDSNSERR